MNISFARKPDWIKVRLPAGKTYTALKNRVESLNLNTVCQEARCPNIEECWNSGTATLMLMGDTCTRGCRFCSVKTARIGNPLDPDEPKKVADTVEALNLKYVVLTSVDRDDLEDGGASHFAATVCEIKKRNPSILCETLIPDFKGNLAALDTMLASGAEVISQNQETVRRLTQKVRDGKCSYETTLFVLDYLKSKKPTLFTKSSLMLGLGETDPEVLECMDDLRSVGVDILTLGQYLQPTKKQLPVESFVHPTRFQELESMARSKGFLYVASGPLVRSSYKAGELFIRNILKERMWA
ncbi:MAG: lipoyl synthase [Deltaproteobacteria bacterium RIFCSPHIGHO2_02_FULL_40_11]|nr:MAG: lipoyl synthase [Deltaproteobacteria bacterium RIFCSPHIGHO2_02_FULL_40_11]